MNHPQRNSLITGSGSGLGRGLSLCLAQQGHSILATDIDLAGAKETVAQIEAAGGKAAASALDVTSEEDIRRFLQHSGGQQIDVLINNAGLQHVAKVEEFPPAKSRRRKSSGASCCSRCRSRPLSPARKSPPRLSI
jgi:3-hydroxybutyrate dehydrogenase